jgi:hypothetical protein
MNISTFEQTDAVVPTVNFSLNGGPLHRFGVRVGLVHGTNTLRLGLAIGSALWAVMVALAFSEGLLERLFSLDVIGAHARLLLVIPLMFLCESWVDPRFAAFVHGLKRSGIVESGACSLLDALVVRFMRWKDAALPEAICVAAAVLLAWLSPPALLTGGTAILPDRTIADMALTGQWYWLICLSICRVLLFRWLWRLGLWCFFLWRVARLELHLVPIHPDGAAGLGFVEGVQQHFSPLVVAFSITQAAGLAEEMVVHGFSATAINAVLLPVLCVDTLLFVGPVMFFSPHLWACRLRGLADYADLAALYVGGFESKWVGGAERIDMLGNPDFQSLADLANSFAIVRNMRTIPFSQRTLVAGSMVAALPFLPLLLLHYPLADISQKLVQRLFGF